jgi:hypothetical protein
MSPTKLTESRDPRTLLETNWALNRVQVSHAQAESYLSELPRRAREAAVRERAARLRCPVHRRPAKLTPVRGVDGSLSFAVDACCERLEQLLALALDYEPPEEGVGGLN